MYIALRKPMKQESRWHFASSLALWDRDSRADLRADGIITIYVQTPAFYFAFLAQGPAFLAR